MGLMKEFRCPAVPFTYRPEGARVENTYTYERCVGNQFIITDGLLYLVTEKVDGTFDLPTSYPRHTDGPPSLVAAELVHKFGRFPDPSGFVRSIQPRADNADCISDHFYTLYSYILNPGYVSVQSLTMMNFVRTMQERGVMAQVVFAEVLPEQSANLKIRPLASRIITQDFQNHLQNPTQKLQIKINDYDPKSLPVEAYLQYLREGWS